MGSDTLGRVTVAATLENLEDLCMVQSGFLSADRVRRIEVDDAQVDTEVRMISMPRSLIRHLGLEPVRTRKDVTRTGVVASKNTAPSA